MLRAFFISAIKSRLTQAMPSINHDREYQLGWGQLLVEHN